MTDIEGSTVLWESHPQEMRQALARHDEIIRSAISNHQGHRPEEQGEGDSVLAAFTRATDAVAAALEIQLAFNAETWPAEARLKVRMAIHSGEAELRDDRNYAGFALSRCARVRSLAHGGQILATKPTVELVSLNLPPGAHLLDLGPFVLSGISQPERVFQLIHDDLPSDFPALKSSDLQHNLPVQLTTFIGREQELVSINKLLGETRLLTLAGPGGAGKTRLAVETARAELDNFADGVWFVDLASITEASLVPQQVAASLRLRELPGKEVVETIADYLADRESLIILDNCEHVLLAATELAERLLRSCPRIRLLATSRAPLDIGGETVWRVPPMILPAESEDVSLVADSDAVRLFVARASARNPDFSISGNTVLAVANVCRRLDGLPLNIELTAGLARVLPVTEIRDRLERRLNLLDTGARSGVPRQRSLEAIVDWSFDLLDSNQKALFRRLSVFQGAFDLVTTESVCSGDQLESSQILEVLSQLVDKSLVSSDPQQDVPYRMLNTVRTFAEAKLQDSGEGDSIRKAHFDWYRRMVDESYDLLESDEMLWIRRLDRESGNLRAAMEWGLSSAPSDFLEMCSKLGRFWYLRGYWTEGRTILEATRPLASQASDSLKSRLAFWTGALAHCQGDYSVARSHYDESLQTSSSAGEELRAAHTKSVIANLELQRGRFADAEQLLEQSLKTMKQLGSAHDLLGPLENLGEVALQRGDVAAAKEHLNEGLKIARDMNWKRAVARKLGLLAPVNIKEGDFGAARTNLTEGMSIAREVQEPMLEAHFEHEFGRLAMAEGNLQEATIHLESALELADRTLERPLSARVLLDLTRASRAKGSGELASSHLLRAKKLAQELDDPNLLSEVQKEESGV